MRLMTKILTMFGVILLAGVSALRAEAVALDTDALATLAVQDHGRKKPFTTFAQETLLTMSGTSALPFKNDDGTETKLSPEQVMLDLWFKPEGWDDRPIIMLNFLELKKKFGLPEDQKLFSFKGLIGQPVLIELLDQAQELRQAGKGDDLTAIQKEAEHLGERLQLFEDCTNDEKQCVVPNPDSAEGRWHPLEYTAVGDFNNGTHKYEYSLTLRTKLPNNQQEIPGFSDWFNAYENGDIAAFNALTPKVVESLRALAPQFYPTASALQFEHHYMTLHPFRWAWIFFLLALITLLLTALWGQTIGYRLTWALVLTGLGFEIYGFACRIIISGRPPVTNMYETVIWVSFGAMLFATILEAIYRKRYFFYAGLSASVLALIVADSQPTILDASINPLTAVLRNNMWLTIHVLTIVSSYAAFALTAALGHIALTMSLWGRRYASALGEVQFFIYRAMQIGVLLLAAGTILGGVWANYSWGRFWGWDPKETWALVTLLCYLALLHGRLAGWWRGFGLAVGSVVCFLSVMMSWYGVNFVLGKGLHSYGFGTGGFSYVACFAVFEMIFVAFVVAWNRKYAPVKAVSPEVSRKPDEGLAGQEA
jgi:ABC-type transport system involved in cytochrome c biogenesis permease subunit